MKTIAQQLNIKDSPFEIKDKNGKQLYYETSDGYWEKREHDSSGNLIYYVTSSGYWYKNEYDSSGNKIYSENPNGDWEKYEFDLEGNEIYYEDSYGVIKDNRPKDGTIKTPMQELIDKLNDVKPTQLCSIETIRGWAESLLDKEKQELKDAFDRGASARAFDMGATAWVSGRTFDDYYNKTHKDKEQ